jgi:hypothetical protein
MNIVQKHNIYTNNRVLNRRLTRNQVLQSGLVRDAQSNMKSCPASHVIVAGIVSLAKDTALSFN